MHSYGSILNPTDDGISVVLFNAGSLLLNRICLCRRNGKQWNDTKPLCIEPADSRDGEKTNETEVQSEVQLYAVNVEPALTRDSETCAMCV